jgi:hypothetical protein
MLKADLFEECKLVQGTYVSFWFQAMNYAVVKDIDRHGIVFKIYKVITDANEEEGYEPFYKEGDIAHFSWFAAPNLKFEKAPKEQEVSYASWT